MLPWILWVWLIQTPHSSGKSVSTFTSRSTFCWALAEHFAVRVGIFGQTRPAKTWRLLRRFHTTRPDRDTWPRIGQDGVLSHDGWEWRWTLILVHVTHPKPGIETFSFQKHKDFAEHILQWWVKWMEPVTSYLSWVSTCKENTDIVSRSMVGAIGNGGIWIWFKHVQILSAIASISSICKILPGWNFPNILNAIKMQLPYEICLGVSLNPIQTFRASACEWRCFAARKTKDKQSGGFHKWWNHSWMVYRILE